MGPDPKPPRRIADIDVGGRNGTRIPIQASIQASFACYSKIATRELVIRVRKVKSNPGTLGRASIMGTIKNCMARIVNLVSAEK
jgi:hypothetical protein